MDFSTLNAAKIKRLLPVYKMPPTYHLQRDPGNGCSGDPPGFPTYFTRSIYTQSGNGPPHNRPQQVITLDGVNYITDDGKWAAGDDWDKHHAKYLKRLTSIWLPLPIDHERTRLWILSTYKHHQHCYNGHGDNMVIWPVPDYKLKPYTDDPKWKDEYRDAHRTEVDAFNKMVKEQAEALVNPDNHNAVRIIRKYYPDYQPDLALIENPPERHAGDWWERESAQPAEDKCPGSHGSKHPSGKTWCQFCGRHYEESAVA